MRLTNLPRSFRLPAAALVAVLAGAAVALALASCGSSHRKPTASTAAPAVSQTITPVATPTPGPYTRRVGPISLFESGLALLSDPNGTLDVLRQLGVDRIKIFVPWNAVAPNATSSQRPSFNAADPGAYPAGAWNRFDAIIRAAKTHGIGVDVTLSTAPQWALGSDVPAGAPHGAWKPSASEFGDYVKAAGIRYSGTYTPPGSSSPLPRVDMWSIWNEPNYGQTLAPSTTDNSTVEVSPSIYRGLLDAAWAALHATGHGHDTVLIGEVGPHGIQGGKFPGTFGPMFPLRFVRALYCVDSHFKPLQGTAASQRACPTTSAGSAAFPKAHPALFEATGFADHPYPAAGIPPNAKTPSEPDDASLSDIPNLESTLDGALSAYGSHRRLPIYSTEYGYQTNPPRQVGNSVTPAVAAVYLNWAEYISWHDPRIASYDQFLLQDPPNGASAGGFPSGLEFLGGAPKPALDAYRMPLYLPVTSAAAHQPLEVWGCVRPAHFAQLDTGRPQRVKIQFKRSGGGAFRTIRTVRITDPHCYFDVRQKFATSGTVRLAWTFPTGQTTFSRSVQIQVH